MKIALLAFSMHFQCIDNALQHVDNGSKCICNVTQSIVKALTMINKRLRMDGKCFSTRWQLFPTFDPNAAQNVENKHISPVATKLTTHSQHSPIALCLQAANIQLNIKILHLRGFDFV